MTNPDSPSRPSGHDAEASQAPAAGQKTPSTDMQADDTGTADSGVESGRGTAAEAAMKQTSKTDAESGSQR